MNFFSKHSFYFLTTLVLFSTIFFGCEKEPIIDDDTTPIAITNFIIPKQMSLVVGEPFSISGEGFMEDDQLVFESKAKELVITLQTIAKNYINFIVPNSMEDGTYTVHVKRGDQQKKFGTTIVTVILNIDVPDKEGYNIKGAVFTGQSPVEGVRVSDGYVTTVTDADGFYWLDSQKKHGYVFISTPSGYQPKTSNNAVPGFWASISGLTNMVEQRNFELVPVDHNKHTIVVGADTHVANRGPSSNNDMVQFRNGFVRETKEFLEGITGQGIYTFMLGDMSWDNYWYSRKYDIASYKNEMIDHPSPIYHVMGNHDNDPYVADDFEAEAKYKEVLGPTYFSMDVGEVHYIFLDNTVYLNTGGKEGTIGERNYQKYVTPDATNWLRDDLAAVQDKSRPIVVSFHCPSTGNYNTTFTTKLSFNPTSKATEFHNLFNEFSNVLFLSGHTHHNTHTTIGNNIWEFNVSAVCATWWWGGKLTGKNIARDGSPAGYAVLEVDGRDIQWYYKGVDEPRTKQFRAYDMNSVLAHLDKGEIKRELIKLPGNRLNDYASIKPNDVLINVWNYDPSWKIEVTESGVKKTVKRVYLKDPLHIITYDYPRMRDNGSVSEGFLTNENPHMFLVSTTGPETTLFITVTDRFGNQYIETMERPKEFGLLMN